MSVLQQETGDVVIATSDKALDDNDHVARGNGDYQQQLAECLRRTLGPAAAISACQALGWDGVIRYLVAPDSQPA